ncbi:hypothetical protein GCM10023213_13990 [Prosthecobacter algae]|uniref:Uncharacterized protein n=1 Tax=Prosthecobacter algae TaxID=1144682 RepID=A0ABP9NZG9_9BACT
MKDDIKKWLGDSRCKALNKQTDGRFNERLDAVIAQGPPNAPTGALWLLVLCGSRPCPADLKRWGEDTAKPKAKA